MIEIELMVYNVKTHVRTSAEGEAWLDQALSWKDSARYPASPDGMIHALDRFEMTFPSGLCRQVLDAAKAQADVTVKVNDGRIKPIARDPNADLTWLRDYQLEAVEAMLQRGRGIVWAPTGSGKTEIMAGLVLSVPCRWLALVHRAQLMDDMAARYEKRTGQPALRGLDAMSRVQSGPQWRGAKPNEVSTLLVETFQTFHSRLKKGNALAQAAMQRAEGLIVDECHSLPAASFLGVAQAAEAAYWRVGLSGTPLQRGEAKSVGLVGALGPVGYRIPATKLIEAGVLARPTIVMTECFQSIQLGPVMGRRAQARVWQKVSKNLVTESRVRNLLVRDLALGAAKPCLVFVQLLDHGRLLEEHLRAAGAKVEFVEGKTALESRKAAIRRLEQGDIDILVATVVFNEGIDIPCLASVVIGGGGASPVQALQRVGRGMRTAVDKSTFEVWDVFDRGSLLENHAKKRQRSYEVEQYAVEVRSPQQFTGGPGSPPQPPAV